MKRYHFVVLASLAIAPFLTSSLRADGPDTRPADTDKEELLQKMQAMQTQMNQMQSQLTQTQTQLQQTQSQLQQTQATTKADAAQTSEMIQELIKDADQRSKLLTLNTGSTGFDTMKGFYIQTDDGQSYFHPGILFDGQSSNLFHPPYHWNTTGIVQFNFDGSIFSRDVTFGFAFNQGLGPNIEYGFVQYVFDHDVFGHDLAFEVGRFKNPVFKETSQIGDPDGLFMAESLSGDLIGGGQFGPQIQGAQFEFIGDNPLHAEASVNAGPITSADNTGTNIGIVNIGLSGRVDYKLFGDWVDTTDLTGKLSGMHDLLDIGGGVDYIDAFSADDTRVDIDAQYQMAQRLTTFGAVYYDHFGFRHQVAGTIPGARNDVGATMEAGYMVTSAIQPIARYSVIRSDVHFPGAGSARIFHELGIGANYYFGPDGSWGNHLKFNMDLDYLPRGTPADGTLLYATSNNGHAEWLTRAEFQLWL
ncbi:MAG: hypothetical protein ABSG31_14600 [Tepidisphaeraceae bacterium]